MMRVSELWIYPIKSCRGIPVREFTLDDRGPEMDRRFMLVDRDNVFMTAREHHRMVLIEVQVARDGLVVNAPGMPELLIDTRGRGGAEQATIWEDAATVAQVDHRYDDWFTEFLAHDCRLMQLMQRQSTTLADAYPMLLIGTGSLDLLNAKLHRQTHPPVSMKRFRPNIVVDETRPHEEDEWKRIRIGDVECNVVKPCARCVLTTVDPETGIAGKEPLRTLSTYRKDGTKVLFGQNLIHVKAGTIRVGDPVSLIASQSAPLPEHRASRQQ